MLWEKILLFREVFKKCGENVCDRYVNITQVYFFFTKVSLVLRGEVKGMGKGGSAGVSVKECAST